jgi:hypothetical protein
MRIVSTDIEHRDERTRTKRHSGGVASIIDDTTPQSIISLLIKMYHVFEEQLSRYIRFIFSFGSIAICFS